MDHAPDDSGCICEACVGENRARLLEIIGRVMDSVSMKPTKEMERFQRLPLVDDKGEAWYQALYDRKKVDKN